MFKKLRGSFLLGIGYMLSPLSWWNDLFFNLPIGKQLHQVLWLEVLRFKADGTRLLCQIMYGEYSVAFPLAIVGEHT